MRINPPLCIVSDTVSTYDVTISYETRYNTRYDIENIIKGITHGYLQRASLQENDCLLELFNQGTEGFNVFIHSEEAIEEYFGLTTEETIKVLTTFTSPTQQ